MIALKSTFVKESYMQKSAFDDFYDFQWQITSKWLFVHVCVNSNENGKMLKAKCLEPLREAQIQKNGWKMVQGELRSDEMSLSR